MKKVHQEQLEKDQELLSQQQKIEANQSTGFKIATQLSQSSILLSIALGLAFLFLRMVKKRTREVEKWTNRARFLMLVGFASGFLLTLMTRLLDNTTSAFTMFQILFGLPIVLFLLYVAYEKLVCGVTNTKNIEQSPSNQQDSATQTHKHEPPKAP